MRRPLQRSGGLLGALLVLHASLLSAELPCGRSADAAPRAAAHSAPSGHDHHHGGAAAHEHHPGDGPAGAAHLHGASSDLPAAAATPSSPSHQRPPAPSRSACCELMAACALQLALPERVQLFAAAGIESARSVTIDEPVSVAASPDTPPPRA